MKIGLVLLNTLFLQVYYVTGTLRHWYAGTLGYWDSGTMFLQVYYETGDGIWTPGNWDTGKLRHWDSMSLFLQRSIMGLGL